MFGLAASPDLFASTPRCGISYLCRGNTRTARCYRSCCDLHSLLMSGLALSPPPPSFSHLSLSLASVLVASSSLTCYNIICLPNLVLTLSSALNTLSPCNPGVHKTCIHNICTSHMFHSFHFFSTFLSFFLSYYHSSFTSLSLNPSLPPSVRPSLPQAAGILNQWRTTV